MYVGCCKSPHCWGCHHECQRRKEPTLQAKKWKSPLLSVGLIGGLFVNTCVLGNHYQFLRSHLYLKTRETWVSLSFRLILRPYRFSLQHQLLYKFRCWSNFLWLVERLVTLHCLFYSQKFQLVQVIGHARAVEINKKEGRNFSGSSQLLFAKQGYFKACIITY